jgi:anaerobic magnesium-protoporphyrin IX monomethyl ester cyclase
MAQIILIQPFTGAWDEMSVRFPESLLAVAAVPVAKGYSVTIVDQRVSRNFKADLERAVGPETVLFGVTAITGEQIRYALELIGHLKAAFPKIPVCVGGVHATLLPEQTAACGLIDYVVAGDGDLVLCALFERLRDGRAVDDLPGVVWKDPSGVVRSNAGTIVRSVRESGDGRISLSYARRDGGIDLLLDLDALPPLPYHLIEVGRYSVFCTPEGLTSATLCTSRGCPYRCKFCSDPVINLGKWRGFSPRRVLEKVDNLVRDYGVRLIYFQDDYFPGSKPRFIEILQGLQRYERTVLWSTLGIRADILAKLDDAEWDLLFASGCHSLEIGIESGNERIIRLINKGETLDQMRQANRKLARYDIKVKYTLIVGFPGETEAEIEDTVRFAAELERTNPHAYCLIFTFLPIIGTPFYEEAVQSGFPEPRSLEEWSTMNFDGWMREYSIWLSPRVVRRLDAVSFVSYFHNKNVAYKFGGSSLLRLAFRLYHPVARWRFNRNFYRFPIEIALKNWILKFKYALRRT